MTPDNKLNFCLTNLVFLALLVLTLALTNPAQGQPDGNVSMTVDFTSSGEELPGQPSQPLAPAQPGSLPMFDPQNPGAIQPAAPAPSVPPLPGEAYPTRPGQPAAYPPPEPSAGQLDFNQLGAVPLDQGYPAAPGYPGAPSPQGYPGDPASDYSMMPLPSSLPVPSGGAMPLVLINEIEPEPAQGDEPPTEDDQAKKELASNIHTELEKWHQEVLSTYVFNPTLLADPFLPIESALPAAANPQRVVDEKNKLPIQKLALSQFTLSAIIVAADPRDSTASVDSGGKNFLIKQGSLIGPNDGYVKQITENSVVIEEPEVNFRGETSFKETVFRLTQLETEGLEFYEE
jgi:Tfp pilus assembly protein PilP